MHEQGVLRHFIERPKIGYNGDRTEHKHLVSRVTCPKGVCIVVKYLKVFLWLLLVCMSVNSFAFAESLENSFVEAPYPFENELDFLASYGVVLMPNEREVLRVKFEEALLLDTSSGWASYDAYFFQFMPTFIWDLPILPVTPLTFESELLFFEEIGMVLSDQQVTLLREQFGITTASDTKEQWETYTLLIKSLIGEDLFKTYFGDACQATCETH